MTDAVPPPLLPHAGCRVELAACLVVAGLEERGCCGAGRRPAGNPLGEGLQEGTGLARVAVPPLTVERARIRERIGGPDAARRGGRRCLSRRNHWRGKAAIALTGTALRRMVGI